MQPLTNETKNHAFSLFQNLLSRDQLQSLANTCQRQRIFTPLVTLRAMLHQALEGGSECRSAVIFTGHSLSRPLSLSNSAFCRARAKLPLDILKNLATEASDKIHRLDQGRIIWVDGFIVNTEDTKELREHYPHTKSQKLGLGHPIIRVLGAFCASTGAMLDYELSKFIGKGQSEPSVLRGMIHRFTSGSTLVMDRFFTSAELLDRLKKQELHFVVRMRASQVEDLFKNKKIREVIIPLRQCYRNKLDISGVMVKVVRVRVQQKGFRPKDIYIMSDRIEMDGDELSEMYRQRWNVEVCIRHLKQTLGLKMIRGKTVAVVQRILAVTVLAYNLTCCLLMQAKSRSVLGTKASFKSACKLMVKNGLNLGPKIHLLIIRMLRTLLFKSPYRREPRAIKRRSNKYPHLTTARDQAAYQVWGYSRRENRARAYA